MASAPRTSRIGLLVAAALLTMTAVVVVTLVPLAPCRACLILLAYEEEINRDQDVLLKIGTETKVIHRERTILTPRPPCRACGNTGKMTLLKKWLGLGT